MTSEQIHVFEKAGLGVAPFKFVGMHVMRGPITLPGGSQVGYPGQPMGTCDFCGQGIANCYNIVSSDGKRFIVGSECVAKTGDKGLKAQVDKIKTQARHEREDKIISENLAWVDSNREALAKIQYGYGNRTLLSSIEWYYRNAGRSGKMKIVRHARKMLEASNG